jgi:uncharacterized protein (TIGR02266 family)
MTEQGRRDPRFPSSQELQVRCDSWGEFAELYAADVSRGGMFIVTERPLPILSEVEVALRLPEGHEVQLQATVVHVIDPEQAARENKKPGLGVQFTHVDALRKRQIQQLVLFATEAGSGFDTGATLASRMFEAAASIPPSRVFDALPDQPADPLRSTGERGPGDARSTGEMPPSGRAPARSSGQPSPRVSMRAGTSVNPGERRASRRTGEQPIGASTSVNPEEKRTTRRTGDEYVRGTSQAPGTSERPKTGNSLPAIEPPEEAAPKQLKPLDPARLKLGMTHVAHRRFDQAIRVFEELVAESGDKQAQYWLHMSRARHQLKNNDDDGAAMHYQKALEIDESNHEARKFVRQHSTKKRLTALPFGRYFVKKN